MTIEIPGVGTLCRHSFLEAIGEDAKGRTRVFQFTLDDAGVSVHAGPGHWGHTRVKDGLEAINFVLGYLGAPVVVVEV